MENINPQEVAIVGTTFQPKWYRGSARSIKHSDKVRGDLILQSLRFASSIGYRVVIVDGGSAKTFVSTIKKIPGIKIVLAKNHKRSPNKRTAIFNASKIPGVRAIVLTEIEKVSLIKDCLPQIASPILHEGYDLVIPKRQEDLFKSSYPNYMYESEVEGNLLYNEALKSDGLLTTNHEDLDVFFGPRVFKNDKKLLKSLLSKYSTTPFNSLEHSNIFKVEEYSNAQFFPVVEALKRNLKVKSVTVPFLYPESQKMNEERGEREFFMMKRKFQKITILVELLHFIGFINNKKTRKIRRRKL